MFDHKNQVLYRSHPYCLSSLQYIANSDKIFPPKSFFRLQNICYTCSKEKTSFLYLSEKKNYLFQPGLNAKILIKILIMVNRFSSFYSIFASIQTTFDFIFKEVFILFPTILSLLLKGLIPCASFFYSL